MLGRANRPASGRAIRIARRIIRGDKKRRREVGRWLQVAQSLLQMQYVQQDAGLNKLRRARQKTLLQGVLLDIFMG